jgi:hypothetical protein
VNAALLAVLLSAPSWSPDAGTGGERPTVSRMLPHYTVVVAHPDGARVHHHLVRSADTLIDALAQTPGAVPGALGGKVRVVRGDRTLAVDWQGITQLGDTATNYQLLPGDRVIVGK